MANHEESETPKILGELSEGFTIVTLLLCSYLSIFAHELIMIFSVPSYGRAANFVPFFAFHPQDCTRLTIEEVKEWVIQNGLQVTHECVDFYGITGSGKFSK